MIGWPISNSIIDPAQVPTIVGGLRKASYTKKPTKATNTTPTAPTAASTRLSSASPPSAFFFLFFFFFFAFRDATASRSAAFWRACSLSSDRDGRTVPAPGDF